MLSRVPFPLDKGDKLRAYHMIKQLASNHKIYLCCLDDIGAESDSIDHLKSYCEEVKVFRLKKLSIAKNLIASLLNDMPFQVNYFYDKSISRQIDEYIKRVNPDRLITQLIRTVPYIENQSQPKILDYMDCFSLSINRRVELEKSWSTKLWKNEAKRLKIYEQKVSAQFDRRIVIAETDKVALNLELPVDIIPNGIDALYFNPMGDKSKNFDLLFVGNMGYPPNIDAVQFLVYQIMPTVWNMLPNVTLNIAGKSPSKAIKSLASDNITVSADVVDIRKAYESAKIFVAPMRIGAGMQNKLLEAMAMELPCITTSIANNTIGATVDKEVLIGDTSAELANHLIELLKNEHLQKRLALAGQKFVKSTYSWEQTNELLEQVLEYL